MYSSSSNSSQVVNNRKIIVIFVLFLGCAFTLFADIPHLFLNFTHMATVNTIFHDLHSTKRPRGVLHFC